MNKKLLIKLSLIVFTLVLASNLVLARAEDGGSRNKSPTILDRVRMLFQRREKKDERESTRSEDNNEDKTEKPRLNRCDAINSNVDEKVARFAANKNKHLEFYTRLKVNLDKLIAKLEAKGYDTTELKNDLPGLNTLVDKFNTDFAAYIEKLKATKAFACGNSNGGFLDALKAAKAALLVVKQDVKDIRDYYKDTIRPDIQAIRSQKASTTEE